MKLVSVAEMKQIEQQAVAAGVSNEQMMRRAGAGVGQWISEMYLEEDPQTVIGLIGKGNNGGDGLLALHFLLGKGWRAVAVLVGRSESDSLVREFQTAGGEIVSAPAPAALAHFQQPEFAQAILLDAVLGTGIKLPLREEVSQLLHSAAAVFDGHEVIALDCPSGVDCDSGAAAEEILPATATLCIEAVKQGLVQEPAARYVGELAVIPLDLPAEKQEDEPKKFVVSEEWVQARLPHRSAFSHKGTFGKVMVIGGSVNYCGAPVMAGNAAYRVGTGLVTLAVPQTVAGWMASSNPEITWLILDEMDGVIAENAAALIRERATDYSCLAIGPGIGREETTAAFLTDILLPDQAKKRAQTGFVKSAATRNAPEVTWPGIVLDADGLRWLAEQGNWAGRVNASLVLTPHPGEMAALTGLSIAEIQSRRLTVASEFAQKWGQVVVLKGAFTVVAAPDGRAGVIPVATSALAKAGSGDVLSGMIAGLLAQGMECFEAAVCGAWIHARCGELAEEWTGAAASVLASDLIDCIPEVLQMIQ
ncbi:MAG: NAD(P)H-hydrate dehydratase [Anaerolineaceae bacterium]|nr:NAD(P)H-hydrate dehydratase [Anaerolineaceae bacterium]